MPNPLEPEQPFRFFDLPRELRDQIYYHSSKSARNFSAPENCSYLDEVNESYICGEPELSLTLVNRQFRTEYLKHIYENMKLVLFRSTERIFAVIPLNFRPIVQHFVIHFFAELKDGSQSVSEQIMAEELHSVSRFVVDRFPRLRKLELRIGIYWDCQNKPGQFNWLNDWDPTEIFGKIKKDTTFDQRDGLQVAFCEQPCRRGSRCEREENEAKAFATWTQKTGWDFGKDTPHKKPEESARDLRLGETRDHEQFYCGVTAFHQVPPARNWEYIGAIYFYFL